MGFQAHGAYHLSVMNRVVIAVLAGPNNEESYRQFIGDLKTRSVELGDKTPWALLFIALNTALMGPEAEKLMLEFAHWAKEKNCSCTAWSVEHIRGGKWIVKDQWERVFSHTPSIKPRFFPTDREAIYWLNARGFSCSLSREDKNFLELHY